MVDPIKFTNYNRNDNELQEAVIFALLVAGKNALTTARLLDKFLQEACGKTPFNKFYWYDLQCLAAALKYYGFGCYNNKAKGIHQLVRTDINLRTCTTEDLEKIHGIGKKTSRFFVLHTRPNAECIPLDVHMLHHLRDLGYNVPKVTPSSKKYCEIEKICIQLAKENNMTCADWDLTIWNRYRKHEIN